MITQVRLFLAPAVLVLLVGAPAVHAQGGTARVPSERPAAPPRSARWLLGGEIGGGLGNTWLAGGTAPTVSTGAGVALSIGAQRSVSRRIAAGGVVRVVAQPLHLREGDARWDGGTLTDTQLLGTIALALSRESAVQPSIEFGGGVALLSGARSLYPFSAAARVTPATEFGVSLQRANRPKVGGATSYPLSLVARYSLVRIDPGPAPATAFESMTAVAGWVGFTTFGIRVQR